MGFERRDNSLFEAILRPCGRVEGLIVKQNMFKTLHDRLGHVSVYTMKKSIPLVDGVEVEMNASLDQCDICVISKSKRKSRKASAKLENREPLELLHSDIQGPMKNAGLSGARYFVPVLDETTGISMVRPIKKKSEAPAAVKEMIAVMENMTQKTVKRFRSDNASEFLSKSFQSYLSQKGIKMETSPPYSPESN